MPGPIILKSPVPPVASETKPSGTPPPAIDEKETKGGTSYQEVPVKLAPDAPKKTLRIDLAESAPLKAPEPPLPPQPYVESIVGVFAPLPPSRHPITSIVLVDEAGQEFPLSNIPARFLSYLQRKGYDMADENGDNDGILRISVYGNNPDKNIDISRAELDRDYILGEVIRNYFDPFIDPDGGPARRSNKETILPGKMEEHRAIRREVYRIVQPLTRSDTGQIPSNENLIKATRTMTLFAAYPELLAESHVLTIKTVKELERHISPGLVGKIFDLLALRREILAGNFQNTYSISDQDVLSSEELMNRILSKMQGSLMPELEAELNKLYQKDHAKFKQVQTLLERINEMLYAGQHTGSRILDAATIKYDRSGKPFHNINQFLGHDSTDHLEEFVDVEDRENNPSTVPFSYLNQFRIRSEQNFILLQAFANVEHQNQISAPFALIGSGINSPSKYIEDIRKGHDIKFAIALTPAELSTAQTNNPNLTPEEAVAVYINQNYPMSLQASPIYDEVGPKINLEISEVVRDTKQDMTDDAARGDQVYIDRNFTDRVLGRKDAHYFVISVKANPDQLEAALNPKHRPPLRYLSYDLIMHQGSRDGKEIRRVEDGIEIRREVIPDSPHTIRSLNDIRGMSHDPSEPKLDEKILQSGFQTVSTDNHRKDAADFNMLFFMAVIDAVKSNPDNYYRLAQELNEKTSPEGKKDLVAKIKTRDASVGRDFDVDDLEEYLLKKQRSREVIIPLLEEIIDEALFAYKNNNTAAQTSAYFRAVLQKAGLANAAGDNGDLTDWLDNFGWYKRIIGFYQTNMARFKNDDDRHHGSIEVSLGNHLYELFPWTAGSSHPRAEDGMQPDSGSINGIMLSFANTMYGQMVLSVHAPEKQDHSFAALIGKFDPDKDGRYYDGSLTYKRRAALVAYLTLEYGKTDEEKDQEVSHNLDPIGPQHPNITAPHVSELRLGGKNFLKITVDTRDEGLITQDQLNRGEAQNVKTGDDDTLRYAKVIAEGHMPPGRGPTSDSSYVISVECSRTLDQCLISTHYPWYHGQKGAQNAQEGGHESIDRNISVPRRVIANLESFPENTTESKRIIEEEIDRLNFLMDATTDLVKKRALIKGSQDLKEAQQKLEDNAGKARNPANHSGHSNQSVRLQDTLLSANPPRQEMLSRIFAWKLKWVYDFLPYSTDDSAKDRFASLRNEYDLLLQNANISEKLLIEFSFLDMKYPLLPPERRGAELRNVLRKYDFLATDLKPKGYAYDAIAAVYPLDTNIELRPEFPSEHKGHDHSLKSNVQIGTGDGAGSGVGGELFPLSMNSVLLKDADDRLQMFEMPWYRDPSTGDIVFGDGDDVRKFQARKAQYYYDFNPGNLEENFHLKTPKLESLELERPETDDRGDSIDFLQRKPTSTKTSSFNKLPCAYNMSTYDVINNKVSDGFTACLIGTVSTFTSTTLHDPLNISLFGVRLSLGGEIAWGEERTDNLFRGWFGEAIFDFPGLSSTSLISRVLSTGDLEADHPHRIGGIFNEIGAIGGLVLHDGRRQGLGLSLGNSPQSGKFQVRLVGDFTLLTPPGPGYIPDLTAGFSTPISDFSFTDTVLRLGLKFTLF